MECALCDYFSTLPDSPRFSPGTFWCAHSALRVRAFHVRGLSMKNCARLKSLLKKITIDHAKKKLYVFTFEAIKEDLNVLLKVSSNKDLIIIVGK